MFKLKQKVRFLMEAVFSLDNPVHFVGGVSGVDQLICLIVITAAPCRCLPGRMSPCSRNPEEGTKRLCERWTWSRWTTTLTSAERYKPV